MVGAIRTQVESCHNPAHIYRVVLLVAVCCFNELERGVDPNRLLTGRAQAHEPNAATGTATALFQHARSALKRFDKTCR